MIVGVTARGSSMTTTRAQIEAYPDLFVLVSAAPSDPINPPESALAPNDGTAGPPAPPPRDDSPPSSGRYASLTRDEAKAEAVRRGLLTTSSRHGLPAIVAMLEAHDHENGGAPAILDTPPSDAVDATPEPTPAPFTSADVVAGFRQVPDSTIDVGAARSLLDRLAKIQSELNAIGDTLRDAIGA